jgi:hypothetical protein
MVSPANISHWTYGALAKINLYFVFDVLVLPIHVYKYINKCLYVGRSKKEITVQACNSLQIQYSKMWSLKLDPFMFFILTVIFIQSHWTTKFTYKKRYRKEWKVLEEIDPSCSFIKENLFVKAI